MQESKEANNNSSSEQFGSTYKVQGLHTLILNKNHKFGDIGVRQLTNILRDDFWLKTLGLRYCGITKTGADTIMEFIQINTVITSIDLKENEIPAPSLQIVGKILKARQTKEGRSYAKKKLTDSKGLCIRTASRKDVARSVEQKSHCRKRQKELRHMLSLSEVTESEELNSMRTNNNIAIGYETDENDMDVEELELRLSNMINCNEALMKEIKKSAELLEEEKNRRIEAEKTCERIKPVLERLRSKFMTNDVIHAKEQDKNQIYQGLRGLLQILSEKSDNRFLLTDENSDIEKSVESANTNLEEVPINATQ